jgi:hypothetical protein
MTPVITRGIREFVGRDWAAVRANKEGYWRLRIARMQPAAVDLLAALSQSDLLSSFEAIATPTRPR